MIAKRGDNPRFRAIAGLLILCFLWSVASLRSDLFSGLAPAKLPPIQRQGLPLALLAIAAALFSLMRREQWPKGPRLVASILVGLGLFVAPAISFLIAKEWLGNLTQVALFSITPVFGVVFEPYIGSRDLNPQARGSLLAALAAVVGTLCVIPAGPPNSIETAGGYCVILLAAAAVAAANCVAVNTAIELKRNPLAPMAAIAALTAVAGLGPLSALTEPPLLRLRALGPELAWSAVAELPELLLLFWLMRRMSAVRMTTRFILTPLLASLIGLVLLRPSVGLRAGAGLLLMAAGATWLLLAPKSSAPGTLPLGLQKPSEEIPAEEKPSPT
jgi:drug/metabolite transporter (DMT)-like permease